MSETLTTTFYIVLSLVYAIACYPVSKIISWVSVPYLYYIRIVRRTKSLFCKTLDSRHVMIPICYFFKGLYTNVYTSAYTLNMGKTVMYTQCLGRGNNVYQIYMYRYLIDYVFELDSLKSSTIIKHCTVKGNIASC